MGQRSYTFYRDGQKYETDNLMAFCRENKLQRRHLNEVVMGKRKHHHGFEYREMDQAWVEDTLVAAEVAARSSEDPEYTALVLRRVEKVRRGEPLRITTGKNEQGEETITLLG